MTLLSNLVILIKVSLIFGVLTKTLALEAHALLPEPFAQCLSEDRQAFIHCSGKALANSSSTAINFRYGAIDDTVEPVSNNFSTYMSLSTNPRLRLWSRNEATGTYDVPYLLDPDANYSEKEKGEISWSMRNLERGSNIRFLPFDASLHRAHLFIQSKKPGCFSYIGMNGLHPQHDETPINLDKDGCFNRHTIQHEILHSLGFRHEHQRKDAQQYIRLDPSAPASIQIQTQPDVATNTPYDLASIMHYDAYLEARDSRYQNSVSSRLVTLTSCDWAHLNQAYPGAKKPPPCIPHEVPDVCEPIDPNCARCHDICRYFCGTENALNTICRIKGNGLFPKDAMTTNAKYPPPPFPPKKHPRYPPPPQPPMK